MIQAINREIRRQTGVDHNIGIKTPVLMHKAGLKNVQARLSDCVRLVLPPIETEYQEAVFQAICDDGYGPKTASADERTRWKDFMVKYGVPEEDADREIDRELAQEFRARGQEYHTAYTGVMSFSFGWVDEDEEMIEPKS